VVFREGLKEKEERLKSESAWGHMPGWGLFPCFIKSNDDLRQEQLASQLIREMASILSSAKVPVWLYPYSIVAISNRAGIIEAGEAAEGARNEATSGRLLVVLVDATLLSLATGKSLLVTRIC